MERKTKVFLAMPSTGQREDFHAYVLDEWRRRYADEIEFVMPDSCQQYFLHDFARNEFVRRFLESDCDIMLFLDSDVVPPIHLPDLITIHGNKGWLAAGAPYPLWMTAPGTADMAVQFTSYKGNATTDSGNKGFSLSPVPKQGTEWVDGLATGCLLLRRELFSQLKKPYFEFKRHPETCEVIEGEDLGFALKLQKLGIKFFCDHGMICGHFKRVNLLEVHNFAVNLANDKINAMHAEIKSQVETAIKAAAAQGYRQGKEAGLKESGIAPRLSNRTASGLILPAGR